LTLEKWKEKFLEELKTAPNHVLLGIYVEAQIPNDYDGGFTDRASWERDTSAKAFYARLVETGWLTQEQLKESGAEDWF